MVRVEFTNPNTRLRTLSPISGEISLPNCCRVVRKRFSLQSCRAPQAGGSCWLDNEAVEDMAGPLLKPLGVDGAPFSDVGEWLLPFSIDLLVVGVNEALRLDAWLTAGGGGGMVGGVDLG